MIGELIYNATHTLLVGRYKLYLQLHCVSHLLLGCCTVAAAVREYKSSVAVCRILQMASRCYPLDGETVRVNNEVP